MLRSASSGIGDRDTHATEPLLVLERLHKRYGDTLAVRELSLTVEAGAFIAIMGPSGCGKTTTLRMLAGLEQPTEGEIYHCGRRITDDKPWRRGMPMVWQSLALFPFLSVLDNVAFGLKMARLGRHERRRRAMAWLERLGIAELASRDISVLSGGQLQRVALARALVTEPDILLLDEPLTALDAHLVVRMQGELSQLQRELGITFIYVTHSQSEAFAMADQVVIMDAGEIKQVGSPRDVYRRPCNRFVAEFVGTNNLLAGEVEFAEGTRLQVRTDCGLLISDSETNTHVRQGQRVFLVISADLVGLAATDDGQHPNRISGSLVSEQFVGTVATLYLDTGGSGDFRVQLQQHALDRLAARPGQRLVASWRPEDCFVLPQDDQSDQVT